MRGARTSASTTAPAAYWDAGRRGDAQVPDAELRRPLRGAVDPREDRPAPRRCRPSDVHAMARGPVAAGGDAFTADFVLGALERAGSPLPEDARALDFGCSSGRVVRMLAAARPDVAWLGCDPNDARDRMGARAPRRRRVLREPAGAAARARRTGRSTSSTRSRSGRTSTPRRGCAGSRRCTGCCGPGGVLLFTHPRDRVDRPPDRRRRAGPRGRRALLGGAVPRAASGSRRCSARRATTASSARTGAWRTRRRSGCSRGCCRAGRRGSTSRRGSTPTRTSTCSSGAPCSGRRHRARSRSVAPLLGREDTRGAPRRAGRSGREIVQLAVALADLREQLGHGRVGLAQRGASTRRSPRPALLHVVLQRSVGEVQVGDGGVLRARRAAASVASASGSRRPSGGLAQRPLEEQVQVLDVGRDGRLPVGSLRVAVADLRLQLGLPPHDRGEALVAGHVEPRAPVELREHVRDGRAALGPARGRAAVGEAEGKIEQGPVDRVLDRVVPDATTPRRS